jgi:polo-like kinase 1
VSSVNKVTVESDLIYFKLFCSLLAPEILQGKNGHSFEVDVWSTGVIVYTLLVGKPPFESKDVESTYKRILSNNFTFPDVQQPLCEHAKGLIRSILQVNT